MIQEYMMALISSVSSGHGSSSSTHRFMRIQFVIIDEASDNPNSNEDTISKIIYSKNKIINM